MRSIASKYMVSGAPFRRSSPARASSSITPIRDLLVLCLSLLPLLQASAGAQTMGATSLRRLVVRPAASPRPTTAAIVTDPGSGIIPASCPDAASAGGTCGYVPVPLFRLDDDGSRINIYFEVYGHSNPGPAISAIVPNGGGPGATTTGQRALWLGVFASNMDAHDLLLVDNRGSGQSATIDCSAFQHGLGPTYADEIAQCAAQLSLSNSQWSATPQACHFGHFVDAARELSVRGLSGGATILG